MINFKEIKIEDKKWMDSLIKASNLSGCHQNFGNLFTWSKINNKRAARINDYLVVKLGVGIQNQGYFYPVGSGDTKIVVKRMMEDAINCKHDFILYCISSDNIVELDKLFPDQFSYIEVRDEFDYVYLLDKMILLPGKKLNAKRSRINYFKKHNRWNFEIITPENLDECWQMNEQWCKEVDCYGVKGLRQEKHATEQYFNYFDQLEVEGALLRVDDKVVAYTMGEILNSDTYVIHIEKAFRDVKGAYPMINREFAIFIKGKYPYIIYINREEDMGYEGLRKAKESYYPYKMEKKYKATFIGK